MAKVKIDGMKCEKCAAKVEKAINAIPGMKAKVDLQNKVADVEGIMNQEIVKKAIEALGFEVTGIE